MFDPRNLVRNNIKALSPYSTARDEYSGEIGVYLDANENPYDNGVNRYPDPYQRALKARLGEIKGIDPANIFIGNGSDEAIDLVYRTFCEPRLDNVVAVAPTYGMYKVAAAINDVEYREVRLDSEFSFTARQVLDAADSRTKALFLCSPNNPTGNDLPAGEIEKLLKQFPGMVVIDEAYIDFTDSKSYSERLPEFPNLIVLQTLSKAWGMAGLRLGMALADSRVIEYFTRVKYPYNINGPTQTTVIGMLARGVPARLEELRSQREFLAGVLKDIPLVRKVYPSDSNFILARVDRPRTVYEKLVAAGIIVRDRSGIEGCEGCLRFTVGTPEENLKLMDALWKISEEI